MLASHGLIVVGVDLFWPAVSSNPTTGNNTTISPTCIQIPALTRNQGSCIKWFNGSARWSTAFVKTNILVFIHELTWYSCWRAVHVCRIAGTIYYITHSFCRIKICVFSPNLLPSIFLYYGIIIIIPLIYLQLLCVHFCTLDPSYLACRSPVLSDHGVVAQWTLLGIGVALLGVTLHVLKINGATCSCSQVWIDQIRLQ